MKNKSTAFKMVNSLKASCKEISTWSEITTEINFQKVGDDGEITRVNLSFFAESHSFRIKVDGVVTSFKNFDLMVSTSENNFKKYLQRV